MANVFDLLIGEVDPASANTFTHDPLAGALHSFLLQRLNTPATESLEFSLGSDAIREGLDRSSATARQRLQDQAIATGNLGGGAVFAGLQDIQRADVESFATGLRQLILGLEQRRTEGVIDFLRAKSAEQLGQVSADVAIRGQNLGLFSSTADNISFGTAKGGGGGQQQELTTDQMIGLTNI
jgi:hypothetical protein